MKLGCAMIPGSAETDGDNFDRTLQLAVTLSWGTPIEKGLRPHAFHLWTPELRHPPAASSPTWGCKDWAGVLGLSPRCLGAPLGPGHFRDLSA